MSLKQFKQLRKIYHQYPRLTLHRHCKKQIRKTERPDLQKGFG